MVVEAKVIEARVYKVYFDYPEGYNPYAPSTEADGKPLPLTSCVVIAQNADEAIAKLKAAFPDKTVASFHSDASSGMMSREKDTVVL